MKQYKLDNAFMAELRSIYYSNKATAICFCKPMFDSGSLGDKLIISYFNFVEENGRVNLEPVSRDGRLERAYSDISTDVRDYESIPTGKGFKYFIDGLEIFGIKGGELNPLLRSEVPDGIALVSDSSIAFGLVYFKIEDLINISHDEVYLTHSSRKFNNLVPPQGGTVNVTDEAGRAINEYDSSTEFSTLFATPENTFSIQRDNLENLRYSAGKPCPPFWSPRLLIDTRQFLHLGNSFWINLFRMINFYLKKPRKK